MDEKQGDGILSLRLLMDKVDFQPFNYGRVVVESVEGFSTVTFPGSNPMDDGLDVKTHLFKSCCSRFQSKLVSRSVRKLSRRLKLMPAEVPVLIYTGCAGSSVLLIWSSIRGTLDDRSMWNGCS